MNSWLDILVYLFMIVIGLIMVILGVKYDKEKHKTSGVADPLDWFIYFFFPWWIRKVFVIGLGLCFVIAGVAGFWS